MERHTYIYAIVFPIVRKKKEKMDINVTYGWVGTIIDLGWNNQPLLVNGIFQPSLNISNPLAIGLEIPIPTRK